jgi:hypothetical protein
MKTKTPLFPKYTMYWSEEDQTHNLEFDGLDGVPIPSRLVLTDIGAIQLKYALCNLPINKTFGKFWGYKDQPIDEGLWNCELPEEDDVLVQVSSKDEKALKAVANHLSDPRCWRNSVALKGGDVLETKKPKRNEWGGWRLEKDLVGKYFLYLDSYPIDLEEINSCAAMLDWIFQLNKHSYSKESVKDLVRAFDDIFDPQANCCSYEQEKKFSGSELVKKYAEDLKK